MNTKVVLVFSQKRMFFLAFVSLMETLIRVVPFRGNVMSVLTITVITMGQLNAIVFISLKRFWHVMCEQIVC